MLDILHHVTPLVQSRQTIAEHCTAIASAGEDVAMTKLSTFEDDPSAAIIFMDDGCFKPRPAKYGETRAPMAFFFRSLMPADPHAKLPLLPEFPLSASPGVFLDPDIGSSILRVWKSSPTEGFMAPLAYIYNATNNQQIESKSRAPKQLARKPFDQWLAGPRLRKYPSLPGLTDVDWPKLCEQLLADVHSFSVSDMTIVDFTNEHLDSSRLGPNFERFLFDRVGALACNYVYVVGDSPVYLSALDTLGKLEQSSDLLAPSLREAMIVIPGALHTARSAGKVLLAGG